MNERYRTELIAWGVRTVCVIALTVVASLVNRWMGVTVEAPPPPAVNILVEPKPGVFGGPTEVRVQPVPRSDP